MGYNPKWSLLKLKRWLWENRILPSLKPKGECLEWTRKAHILNYGRINVGSLLRGNLRQFLAHRIALEVKLGRHLPKKIGALHSCDNPKCCNPDHLFTGTQAENMHDSVRKKRHARGIKNGHAKLTEDDVLEIRHLRNSGTPLKELSERFGVVESNISSIAKRRKWRHIK